MKYLFPGIFVFFVLYSCKGPVKTDMEAVKGSMMKADIAFSDLSKEKGMKAAFLAYIDSGGILLRPNNYPIIGKDAREFLQNVNDSAFTLTWAPAAADASSSGDLGFTYGIYTLNTKDTTIRGTYVSVWKKQADGNWKFVLDTGNPGLGKEK